MQLANSSHYVTNNGVRIHYRKFGSGPALMLVHGHPDNEMTFSHQIGEFLKDFTLILPTVRGYPPSDVPLDEDAYGGDVMASDLLAILDDLGFEKAIIGGGDVGGILVQKLAFKHPERFRGLVIFNTPILGHHDAPDPS